MESKTFAYVRVSTVGQKEDRQLEAVKPYVVNERDIFIDKISGKNFDRPQYQALKSNLRKGDLLIIKSIDRLGRNYTEILNEWKCITKDIGCDIMVLDMEMLDTRNNNKVNGLTGTFICDLVLQILAYVAENERTNIKQRQTEGIVTAKRRGVKFGRPKIDYPNEFEEVFIKWKKREITAVRAMQLLSLKPNTFYRLVNEYQDQGNHYLK